MGAAAVEYEPTAHASAAENVLMPYRVGAPVAPAGLGLATTLHDVPFHRSVSVPEPAQPTAQTLSAALPSTPRRPAPARGGLLTAQPVPFQRAARPSLPTAQTFEASTASTPLNPEGPDGGEGTTDQVAARAGLAGTTAAAPPASTVASAKKQARRRDIDILIAPPKSNNANEHYRKQGKALRQREEWFSG
jgi:hypothetical protein